MIYRRIGGLAVGMLKSVFTLKNGNEDKAYLAVAEEFKRVRDNQQGHKIVYKHLNGQNGVVMEVDTIVRTAHVLKIKSEGSCDWYSFNRHIDGHMCHFIAPHLL